jgi:hypothetical protein
MINKKAQVSLEMVIIVGVLVLGTIVLATILISMSSSKVDQSSEIGDQAEKVVDDFMCSLGISVDPASAGTVSGDGVYPCGSQVTVRATAFTGHTFNNWTDSSGSVLSSSSNYLVELDNSISLVANFS